MSVIFQSFDTLSPETQSKIDLEAIAAVRKIAQTLTYEGDTDMADSKLDWRGMGDSTPGASPETDPRKQPDRTGRKPGDWHGMEDSTPAAGVPSKQKAD